MTLKLPDELSQAAQIAKEKGACQTTPRQLVKWYGFKRRGAWIVSNIRRDLKKLGIRTEPDFEAVWADVSISLIPNKEEKAESPKKDKAKEETNGSTKAETVDVAPANRVSRLKAANTKPVSVKPTDKLQTAITLMMLHDYSQLPVMTSEREVKGVISWRSIGNHLALKLKCEMVKDCMDTAHEERDTASIFDVMRKLSNVDCILIRDKTNVISGIVTATDISEQFQLLSEPFLLLADIENDVRRLIERNFAVEELKACRDPADSNRKVDGVADLTFGEYVRLLDHPERWEKVNLPLDRTVFAQQLKDIRDIRNDVMHFDPDGIDQTELQTLRQFAAFIDRMVKQTAGE